MTIQASLRKAEQSEADGKAAYENLQAQLKAERAVLTRLHELEGGVAQGQMLFDAFKEDIEEYCQFDGDPGEWLAHELMKRGHNLATLVELASQIAAHAAVKSGQDKILSGLRKGLLGDRETELADFRKANVVVIKKYVVTL
jgi:hypothetical protein